MESRLGLERTYELLERLGNPQKQLRFVHVAGTNGKGSTCAFLASIMRAAGYKTGLFTSPYIVEFADRIRVDGRNISEEDLYDTTRAVKEAADAMADHPTEFELMTAVAFLHFARQACDIVVCEVGMGGRLDSTNVIEAPELCVITQIALDHVGILGDTIAKIAVEKAGIIKAGVPVVSWPQDPEAKGVVSRIAAEKAAPLTTPDFSKLHVRDGLPELSPRMFDYKCYDNVQISLMGSYQPSNAAMAIEAVEVLRRRGWTIDDAAVRTGLSETRWPARFEIVGDHPTIILDGGHNAEGAKALVESMRQTFPGQKAVFLIGLLADKEYDVMVKAVLPLAVAFVCFTVPSPRALPAEDLAEAINNAQQGVVVPVEVAASVSAAFDRAYVCAGEQGIVCAFGSLYSVAELKKAISQRISA